MAASFLLRISRVCARNDNRSDGYPGASPGAMIDATVERRRSV